MVWEAKVAPLYISHVGVPGRPVRLMAARHAVNHQEIKSFVSNAPTGTTAETLLRISSARFPVERCFEDGKTELGLDHFEVRHYCLTPFELPGISGGV